ncbi:MAG: hypothetical protein JWR19_3831 [Pedosphaera sp.]|nr:hypothetical protein [Pedosphaera sp.]
MVAGFVLALALPDLLFDLLGHQINGGVKIGFRIFREQVRARHGKSHRAGKLPFGGLGRIMLQTNTGIDGKTVKMFQLVDPDQDMVLDGLGKSYVVRRENQFHSYSLRRERHKIQQNSCIKMRFYPASAPLCSYVAGA